MRGTYRETGKLFSYASPESLVPHDHPLRAIRVLVNAALDLTTPLVYQTGPKTSAKSGWSCSMSEKRCISGRSRLSGIMGIRS